VPPPARSLHAVASISSDVWHQRLGHPGRTSLARVLRAIDPSLSPSVSHTCTPSMFPFFHSSLYIVTSGRHPF
jgi:hypothetical protein